MKKVLFVNKANPGSIIPELLSKTGVDVRITYDIDPAMELLRYNSYDLIIMVENPARECGMLCAAVRRLTGAPLLVISCGASAESCAKALDAGADFFLRKPFGPMELLSRVNTLFQRLPARQPAHAF